MRPRLTTIALALASLFAGPVFAQEIEYRGFIDSYHAVRVHEPYDFLSSRTRLRFESWLFAGDATFFVSFNAYQNSVIVDNTDIKLKEAYLEYAADNWDLRVGRQIIVWGQADGLAITDVVSPWDYTEFLAQDFDDIRMPVEAVRGRLLFDDLTIEVIWLPGFQSAILAPEGTPWAFSSEIPEGLQIVVDETIEPESSFENSEIGGKASIFLPWGDVAFSAFYTWDDLPTLNRKVFLTQQGPMIRFQPEHYRSTFLGAEFSIPWSEFIIRGESAYYFDRRFEPSNQLSEELFARDMIKWMLGLDWSPGGDWSISAQFTDDVILDYVPTILDDRHSVLATLSISKKLLRQTLELASFSYIDLTNSNAFVRSYADYALTDEFHMLGGYDIFAGEGGFIGQFKNNDEVWMKVKYSF